MGSNEIDWGEPVVDRYQFLEEPFPENKHLEKKSSDMQFVHQIGISGQQSDSSNEVPENVFNLDNDASVLKPLTEEEVGIGISSWEVDGLVPFTHSSDSELSGMDEDSSYSPLRGLDHYSTAPVATVGVEINSLLGSHPIAFSRCKTFNDSPRPDLILERLTEHEKLIVDLVKIQGDGSVEVDLEKSAPIASDLLELKAIESEPVAIEDAPGELNSIPRLNIAMLVVGTRGDVQPFLAIAKRLKEFGHRVRLATHISFKGFVESAGVEFYPLGGDPRVLAKYMAKNKGLFPSAPGDIANQRKQVKAIIQSLLPACTESNTETGAAFRAQAIIANPPSYGHAHVAEALGVPMHLFFTMPWTPTSEYPHPFARVPQAGNWLSYILVDLFIWWGIGKYINAFRTKVLKLAPITYFSMYHGSISHIPTGYMWSPHVVPKPRDWGPLVDVVGYCFLDLGSKYQPQEELVQWIQQGPKPIYIGFGSMPLDNPREKTRIIMEALKETGQRGILDRGWGDLGLLSDVPENIFLLEDCPHDWLFPQCSAVVHHGGAGTTATGLKAGCPTTVVPFFGDQFFWADSIYKKGVGPKPIPINQLSVKSLSNALRFMLKPEVKSRAMEVAKLIENEDGASAAVDAFHSHLPSKKPLHVLLPSEGVDCPDPLQRFFTKIGGVFCLACS